MGKLCKYLDNIQKYLWTGGPPPTKRNKYIFQPSSFPFTPTTYSKKILFPVYTLHCTVQQVLCNSTVYQSVVQ